MLLLFVVVDCCLLFGVCFTCCLVFVVVRWFLSAVWCLCWLGSAVWSLLLSVVCILQFVFFGYYSFCVIGFLCLLFRLLVLDTICCFSVPFRLSGVVVCVSGVCW